MYPLILHLMILVDVEFFGIIVLHNKSFGASVCIYELNAFKSLKKNWFQWTRIHDRKFIVQIVILYWNSSAFCVINILNTNVIGNSMFYMTKKYRISFNNKFMIFISDCRWASDKYVSFTNWSTKSWNNTNRRNWNWG